MLPILFQNNSFILYSYPLLMGLAWGIGYQIFFHHIKKSDQLFAQIFYWGIFISAWIGAKVLFIITSSEQLTNDFLISSQFWLGGGFVFYGGLIGGVLFVLLYHLIKPIQESWMKWALVALVMGHGIGRIGCFLAGCCYGEVTDLWWGIHLHGQDRHPTQLIESVSLIGLAFALRKMNNSYLMLAIYGIGYGILRFILEHLRADQLRGMWAWEFTPSQWISVVLIISGVYFLNKARLELLK